MPRGDRTGPLGDGPMTGRQLGYGAGYDGPGYTKVHGTGLGRCFLGRSGRFGQGYGKGFRFIGGGKEFDRGNVEKYRDSSHFDQDFNKAEINSLKTEIRDLKDSITSILERLGPISSKNIVK